MHLRVTQWENTKTNIDLIQKLKYKHNSEFIQADINYCYSSIPEPIPDKDISLYQE